MRQKMAKHSPPQAGEIVSRRDQAIGAALEVLARHGARGFTHREIDRHLDWPEGSTSNYFGRRNDLLAAVGARIMDLDIQDAVLILENLPREKPVTIERVADRFVNLFERWMRPENRSRALARMEVTVERIRNEELRTATQKQIALAHRQYHAIFEQLGAKDPSVSAAIFSRLLASMHVVILEDSGPPGRLLLKTLLRDWLSVSLNAIADRKHAKSR